MSERARADRVPDVSVRHAPEGRLHQRVQSLLWRRPRSRSCPSTTHAIGQDGSLGAVAQVAELTALWRRNGWPDGCATPPGASSHRVGVRRSSPSSRRRPSGRRSRPRRARFAPRLLPRQPAPSRRGRRLGAHRESHDLRNLPFHGYERNKAWLLAARHGPAHPSAPGHIRRQRTLKIEQTRALGGGSRRARERLGVDPTPT